MRYIKYVNVKDILKTFITLEKCIYLAYSISTSHTAMMWQILPRRTKKWKTECMKRFLLRL